MKKFYLKDVLGWGLLLWLIGYILGFVFFVIVPTQQIGWFVTPFGIAITVWALFKKVQMKSMKDALMLGIGWSIIAIVCDFLFMVLPMSLAVSYYKLDVYLYYLVTFALPMVVWKWNGRKSRVQ